MGYDPGTTTALAFLDLSGSVLGTVSGKNVGIKWVLEKIVERGKPVLLAVDVNPPPKKAEYLAAQLGVRLWYPRKSMGVLDKERVTEGYGVRNDHERDALAAVLGAYGEMGGKIRNALKRGGEEGVERLLNGERVRVEERGEDERKEKGRKKRRQAEIQGGWEGEREVLVERIKELERKVQELEDEVERARREVYREVMKEEKVRKLEMEKRVLQRKIRELVEENKRLRRELEEIKKEREGRKSLREMVEEYRRRRVGKLLGV